MRTLKLTLAYDGTEYFGWQFQPDAPTIQGALEAAWRQIARETLRVAGSGRTDAGVHALGQVASLHTETQLACDVLRKALNATLPRDIVVLEVLDVDQRFHAIRDCVKKRYRYVITDGPAVDVFQRRFAWHLFQPLDADAMQRAAAPLLGRHDFASFQTQGTARETTVRTVLALEVVRQRAADEQGRAGGLTIEVEADGFLYNMVRTIAGTLVQVGKGVRDETWPAEVLAARDRRVAGMTAPPQGLFLLRAWY